MITLNGVGNIVGTWPDATAVDDPVAGVGTNLEASWLTDLFGIFQAMLYQAGMVPSGSQESKTVSQFINAMSTMFATPGELVPLLTSTIPKGARLLKLEGQTVSIVTYPGLLNIWCQNQTPALSNATAPAFYRVDGVGARDAAGNFMVLADARGAFLRGYDVTATRDPDGTNRKFGDTQAQSIRQHSHDNLIETLTSSTLKYTTGGGANMTLDLSASTGGGGFKTGTTGTNIGSTAATNETRPVNMIVTWCVRY
jgi:hypothetical protein